MAGVALNAIAFQAGWFACVLGAAYGAAWIGLVVAAIVVAFHLSRATDAMPEVQLIAIIMVLGALWDSALVRAGWIAYPTSSFITGAAPHWIVALWILFATTLNVSMRWLKPRLWLALALGALCGPLSYWGASRLGAVQFVDPVSVVIALAVGWALIMPGLMLLARRFDGYAPLLPGRKAMA